MQTSGERLYRVEFSGGFEMKLRAYDPSEARRLGQHAVRGSGKIVVGAKLVKETKEEREANRAVLTTTLGHAVKTVPAPAKFDASIVNILDVMDFLKANPGTEFFKVTFNDMNEWCFYNEGKGIDYCRGHLNDVMGRITGRLERMAMAQLHVELCSVKTRGEVTPSNDLRWQYARIVALIKKRLRK